MATHQVHSIEEFIKIVKSWRLSLPLVRFRIQGSAVSERRGATVIVQPVTEVTITAARRNDASEEGYEIVRFSFDYVVGENHCRVYTNAQPKIQVLPTDNPPRAYRDRLQLEGFLVEQGEWSKTSAQQALNLEPN